MPAMEQSIQPLESIVEKGPSANFSSAVRCSALPYFSNKVIGNAIP
jgi:hypothetical protein